MAQAATETAKVPRLIIQQPKLTRGTEKLELQLNEWGYEAHREWAKANKFAGAMVCPTTGKMLEYRDLIRVPELRQTWMRSLAKKWDGWHRASA